MTEHDATHDAWLEAVACGDLDADSAEAEKRLAECGECRDRIAMIRELPDLLDVAGREVSRTLETSNRLPRGSHAEVANALARVGVTIPARRRRLDWIAALAIAAAVVLAVMFRDEPAPLEQPIVLGGGFEMLSPLRIADGYDRFAWRYSSDFRGSYSLEIESVDSAGVPTPITHIEDITTMEWRTAESVRSDLTPPFRWRVIAIDATGGERSSPYVTISSD